MSWRGNDPPDPPTSIRTREYEELLLALDSADCRGVLILGQPGIGKTSLLRLAQSDLVARGHTPFFIRLLETRDERDLGSLVLRTVLRSPLVKARGDSLPSRSSVGEASIDEVVVALRSTAPNVQSPILLLDGLDEAPLPLRVASVIEALSRQLDEWKIVVSSRLHASTRLAGLPGFHVLELRGLRAADSRRLLQSTVSGVSDEALDRAVELSQGNPLILRLLAEQLRDAPDLSIEPPLSLTDYLTRTFERVLSSSADPSKTMALLDRLALVNRPQSLTSVAADAGMSVAEVRRVLSEASLLVVWRDDEATVSLAHAAIRDFIVTYSLFKAPFRLADLKFGAEEAEKDNLLEASYVQRPVLGGFLDSNRTIVIGDRGSGKSALFRKLRDGGPADSSNGQVSVLPLDDPYGFLDRIIVKGSDPSSVEEYRAAWLLMVACVLASAVPAAAPKQLRVMARGLRSAFALEDERPPRVARLVRAVGRKLSGTGLKFAVGPVNLEMKVPDGSHGPTGTLVDVEKFMRLHDQYLAAVGERVVVPIDRIDEVFKYARHRQETLVQGLLQAESTISQLENLRILVFLRTDLFETYDIQEKNKLVSRTLVLEWSEEDLLRLLVNRVFANPPVQKLASRLGRVEDSPGKLDIPAALVALFPGEVEGQPTQRWLIECLRNGNGSIAPRLVILFLLLVRDLSEDPEATVSGLPLFSGQAARDAMTKVSDLSYSEIVDDFQVARSFVLNCRAGKVSTFELCDIEELFDPAEGTVSLQVRLLERLGFLERMITDEAGRRTPVFRIPALYTRCWDHA